MNGDSGQCAPGRLQEMQSPKRIDLEIYKWNRRGAVMRRLRGRVDDKTRFEFLDQGQHGLAVADIQILVPVALDLTAQGFQRPAGIAFRPKKYGPLIVVDSDDSESVPGEEKRRFGSD